MAKKIQVTAKVAALSGLVGGLHTVKDIAKATATSPKSAVSALSLLQKKGLATRTNKKGFGVTATYKVTKEGRLALREEKKKLRNPGAVKRRIAVKPAAPVKEAPPEGF